MRTRFAFVFALLATPSFGQDKPMVDDGAKYDDDASLPEHAEDVVDYTLTREARSHRAHRPRRRHDHLAQRERRSP